MKSKVHLLPTQILRPFEVFDINQFQSLLRTEIGLVKPIVIMAVVAILSQKKIPCIRNLIYIFNNN